MKFFFGFTLVRFSGDFTCNFQVMIGLQVDKNYLVMFGSGYGSMKNFLGFVSGFEFTSNGSGSGRIVCH